MKFAIVIALLVLLLPASPQPEYSVYIGDLHNHTSYSDGEGLPSDAFLLARSRGADFLAVTDHSHSLTPAEWQDTLNAADTANVDGQFVGLAGYEYGCSTTNGHINVLGVETLVDCLDIPQLTDFYTWIGDQPDAIGVFNHPTKTDTKNWDFVDFEFNENGCKAMLLRDMDTAPVTTWPGPLFETPLQRGWRVGVNDADDEHHGDFGGELHTGIVAQQLTREAVMDALRQRRTFVTQSQDFTLIMQANGRWMGEAIVAESVTFTATVTAAIYPVTLTLVRNGAEITSTVLENGNEWFVTQSAIAGDYYYIIGESGGDRAYTSPVWIDSIRELFLPIVLRDS